MDELTAMVIVVGFFVEMFLIVGMAFLWAFNEFMRTPRDARELKKIKRKHLLTRIWFTADGHWGITGVKRLVGNSAVGDKLIGVLPTKVDAEFPEPPEEPLAFDIDGKGREISEAELKLYKERLDKYAKGLPRIVQKQELVNNIVTKRFINRSTGSPSFFQYVPMTEMFNAETVLALQDPRSEEIQGDLLDPSAVPPKFMFARAWLSSDLDSVITDKEEAAKREVRSMTGKLEKLLPLLMVGFVVIGIIAVLGLVFYFLK